MGKKYYARLAADNIRKNKRVYIPYILTCVMMSAMIYIISSLAHNPDIANLKRGSRAIPVIMTFGTYVTMVFAFIFMFYSNSFIVKRRRREFGLLNILGMEKRHIAKLLLIENFYVILITAAAGLGAGVLLDKLMSLTLSKMVGASVTLGFHISLSSLALTAMFMLAAFFVIYIYTLGQIHISKPAELLIGSSAGEKEPKTKLVMALLGTVLLGVGYYISIVTKEPTKMMTLFLIAILCVVLGTYLIFASASIALLKALKKRERFYYKTRHFAAVSGLIYRMKRNAVGLASVCILSTMVLVMVSVTSSMMIGVEDMVRRECPRDVHLNMQNKKTADKVVEMINERMDIKNAVRTSQPVFYFYGDPYAPSIPTADDFIVSTDEYGGEYTESKNKTELNLIHAYVKDDIRSSFDEDSDIRAEDYNVPEGKIIIVTGNPDFKPQTLTFAGITYDIAKTIYNDRAPGGPGFDIVMHSRDDVVRLMDAYDSIAFKPCFGTEYFDFDYASGSRESQDAVFEELFSELNGIDPEFGMYYMLFSDRMSQALEIFGSLFFLGLFLGTLFLIETVLIIYYKQLSEGHEDQKRFEIMQNVGMSRREVKRSIRSQILLVFFLPLIVAGVHLTFAFPLVKRLLFQVGLENTKLYMTCSVVGFAGFALIYTAIYAMTARTYYKIVHK